MISGNPKIIRRNSVNFEHFFALTFQIFHQSIRIDQTPMRFRNFD